VLCCCLLQEEFGVVLDYVSLGFVSVIQMASNLCDVFHCVRPDGTDWKLFDARKELPPYYSSYDIRSNKIGELYELYLLCGCFCCCIKSHVCNWVSADHTEVGTCTSFYVCM
jgi:hypothetical protein